MRRPAWSANWRAAIAAVMTAIVATAAVIAVGLTVALVPQPSAPDQYGSDPSADVPDVGGPGSAGRIAEPRPYRPPSPPVFTALLPDEVAALPEARYDAVIPGLIDADHPTENGLVETSGGSTGIANPETADSIGSAEVKRDSDVPERSAPSISSADTGLGAPRGVAVSRTAYSVLTDAPLYGADRTTPVARLGAVNFLGEPTVVVPVDTDGEWTRVLTPARRQLPSLAEGVASAQTSGWLRSDLLVHPVALPHRIVVSVESQSLTILTGEIVSAVFDVGIGTPDTPTPVGVTGYVQARYLDPSQGQAEHRVQLTSLHSTAADEPYGGTDGGLIGIHHSPDAAGTVSHGCIRLSDAAIDAVDALPLGTPVTVLS